LSLFIVAYPIEIHIIVFRETQLSVSWGIMNRFVLSYGTIFSSVL
jgi:hypothetical protein